MCIIRCFDLDYWIFGNRWLLLLQALPAQMSRIAVLAAVYDYWKSKPDHWQKPFLHRLQPPLPVNDINPFNVFRPREKAHRPHTQRHDSVLVEKEESRFTPYRISYADEVPHHLIDSGDQDNGVGHFYAPFDYTTYVMDNATMGVQIKAQKQTQKQFAHLHNQHRKKMNSANALQPSFLFSKPLDPKKLAAANITTLHNTIPYHSCGRTGRGGCLIFDRWNPLT